MTHDKIYKMFNIYLINNFILKIYLFISDYGPQKFL